MKPYYALNNSIIGAQQSPHEAERIVVYNWASAARISGENSTFLSNGRYSDSYNHDYHNSYISDWIKKATLAITLADNKAEDMTSEHDKNFNQNIKSFARIWRAVMISEYSDNFGPYPIAAFQGTNPEFNSVKDVYYFLLDDLKAAVADIVLTEEPTADEAKSDPIFGYNAQKWAKYGNSLRLRLAMRLSEVDGAKAKSEFEAVDKSMLITTMDDIAQVKEYNQWNAWAGVYSRSWNIISLPSTMSNILVGLGGVSVAEQRPDLAQYTKPMDYLGLQFADHYADKTDNPTKGFWIDGIPENLDPRALRIYCIPGDKAADNFRDYGSSDIKNTTQPLNDADGEKISGEYSEPASASTAFGGATNVTPYASSDSSIVLKWNLIKGATSYNVYKKDSETGNYVFVDNTAYRTYTVNGLEEDTTYKFAVSAVRNVDDNTFESILTETGDVYYTKTMPSNAKKTYDIFKSGTFGITYAIPYDDKQEISTETYVKNGNFALIANMAVEGLALEAKTLYLKDKNEGYVIVPFGVTGFYTKMTSEDLKGEGMDISGIAESMAPDINDKVPFTVETKEYNGQMCTCEGFVSTSGKINVYYFNQSGTLVAIEEIPVNDASSIMKVTKFSSTVDDKVFKLPTAFPFGWTDISSLE